MGRTKTFFLMTCLVLIFMYIGNLTDGTTGMMTALFMAFALNFFGYFFSDKLVLKQYQASETTFSTSPELCNIVKRLADKAGLPMPKVYIIPDSVPNAFATGRNPSHAAVAVTQGLLNLMSEEEIEGVLAHELSHIRHYDILTGSIAAIFAGAISGLGNLTRHRNNRSNNNSNIITAILMPIAAIIIQMTISRTREYAADEGSARLTGHPEWLISSLTKLEGYAQNNQMQNASASTSHLFIVNPFSGLKGGLDGLFRTHPSTKDRIAHLNKIKTQLQ